MRLPSLAAIAFSLTASHSLAEDIAGYDRFDVRAEHRARLIAASVWYPAGSKTYVAPIGDNPIFKGERAFVGAGVAEGEKPLVLISHGSGGNMDALAWLSSSLAKHGAIVLAVDHQGSTSGDSSPRRSVRLDERAKDLTAALDALLADPNFARFVDRDRIFALGFSLGGATALNLGGLRFERDAYTRYCAERVGKAVDCAFLARGGVDFDNLPKGFSADVGDPRIRAVIAIDPAFTYAANAKSVADARKPMLLINLGRAHRMTAADVGAEGSGLAGRLPDATYIEIAPANHFTFLAECKENAAALLREEGEDPICDDPQGTDRSDAHRQIVEAVVAFIDG